MLQSFIHGDMDSFFDVVDKDVVFDTDIGKVVGDESMAGTYKGHAGINKLIGKEVEALDFSYATAPDGKFALMYKYLLSVDDGKTAFFEYEIPGRYKATGAEYLTKFKAYFKVNDVGLVVDYGFYESSTIQISGH